MAKVGSSAGRRRRKRRVGNEDVTPEEAFEIVKDLESTVEEIDKHDAKNTKRTHAKGGKKPNRVKCAPVLDQQAMLVGAPSLETSKKIRQAVALSYAGLNDREIGEKLGVSESYVNGMRQRYPEAHENARKTHLAEASRDYHRNLVRVKAALSSSGPRAVQALDQVMSDPETNPGVRVRAAEAILKLLGANEKIMQDSHVAKEFLSMVQNAMTPPPKDQTYVVDIDAEYEELIDKKVSDESV